MCFNLISFEIKCFHQDSQKKRIFLCSVKLLIYLIAFWGLFHKIYPCFLYYYWF